LADWKAVLKVRELDEKKEKLWVEVTAFYLAVLTDDVTVLNLAAVMAVEKDMNSVVE